MRVILATALLLAACDATAPQGSAYAVTVTTDGGVTIGTDEPHYNVGTPIYVRWDFAPRAPDDTITIARRGSFPGDRVVQWVTRGVRAGEHRVDALPKGEYVVRAFAHVYQDTDSVWNGQQLAETTPFVVCTFE